MTSVCSWPAPLACLVIRKPLRFWPRARNRAKTRQGPSFAQQKFFAPCPKSLVLSECGGAKEGQRRTSRHGGLRNELRVAGWATCYECEFEPKTVWPDETARMIAHMTKTWPYRPSKKKVPIRGLTRLHGELPACTLNQRYSQRHPRFFIELHVNAKGAWHHSSSLRRRYRQDRSCEGRQLGFAWGSSVLYWPFPMIRSQAYRPANSTR